MDRTAKKEMPALATWSRSDITCRVARRRIRNQPRSGIRPGVTACPPGVSCPGVAGPPVPLPRVRGCAMALILPRFGLGHPRRGGPAGARVRMEVVPATDRSYDVV